MHWIAEPPLAPLTTLGVGGPAHRFARVGSPDELAQALRRAADEGLPVTILGGGSNVLVADAGVPGLVLQPALRGVRWTPDGVIAGAGVVWDDLVAGSVARGFAGVECLSGIPGSVGAAPIQNIGAYGQELVDVARRVHVIERRTGDARTFEATELGFGYRWSHLKGAWAGRYVVTALELDLRPGGAPTLRYRDLADLPEDAPLASVRRRVLSVRRAKGMVHDPGEPDSCSAGSFFTNPLVSPGKAHEVAEEARRRGLGEPPRYPAGEWIKLSAAWLIERSGTQRGERCGGAAVSSRHVLALSNPGGATAADVLALAGRIRRRACDAWGVTLHPEPVFLGFDLPVDQLLEPP